jgi:hypothetical protein
MIALVTDIAMAFGKGVSRHDVYVCVKQQMEVERNKEKRRQL